MFYAVEGRGLDHRVMRHVVKYKDVSDGEFASKAVISDYVARKAGRPAEAEYVIGLVREEAAFLRIAVEVIVFAIEHHCGRRAFFGGCGIDKENVRAVGHFDDIRHVGGGGDIEDGEFVVGGFEDIHHGCAEDAGMDRHGLAGLQPDLDVVFLASLLYQLDEQLAPSCQD